jgi:N-acetylneuraminate synthase/N,N'-diacetyllegionaminate synthase
MTTLAIGARKIGAGTPCFLVAEIGINHNGDLDLARRTIDAAVAAGADSVKFQNYVTEDFISDRSLTYEYTSQGRRVIEPQYDMFKRCELSPFALRELKHHCDGHDIIFHSTPTSPKGVRDLVDIGTPVLKNGSDYLTHGPLIRGMGESGLPTVLSTGMATLAEIDESVRIFRSTGNEQLVLLHCTSSYPTPAADVHLRKMPALATAFGCLVGFSDHTDGLVASLGAVTLGACWIEKHFTLDKNLPGPDHRFSADPSEFRALVQAVRFLEQSLGESRVGPAPSEDRGRSDFRLSCVARRPLARGQRIDWDDVAFRRPGTGLPPGHAQWLIGRTLRCDVNAGDVLVLEACA